jgi:hypothetical protein
LTDVAGSRVAVAQDGNRQNGFVLQYAKDINRWRFTMNSGDIDATKFTWAASAAPPELNEWTHLTGIYDAGAKELRLHVNGNLEGKAAFTSVWNAGGPLSVGRGKYLGQPIQGWLGEVDQVRLYAGVPTLAQISTDAAR